MDPLRIDQFAGTRIEGTVAFSEPALNELLRAAPARLAGVTLTIEAGNQLVVRYGVLHATATLSNALEAGPSPRLTLTLASFVVAVALKAALRQPYVTVSGRRVTVHLADVPALQSIRGIWPHVRRADLSTRSGRVQADVLFAVDEDTDA